MNGKRYLLGGFITAFGLAMALFQASHAAEMMVEPVHACVIARDTELTDSLRAKVAQCLGWQKTTSVICGGDYRAEAISPIPNGEVRIAADEVSFYRAGRSTLTGNVEVQQEGRIVNAKTAYVYRNAKTNQVTQIELLGKVKYLEAGRLMIARKATINPQDKSGKIEDVLYRLDLQKRGALLPAWGRASLIERFANKDYLLRKGTYTTCAPEDKAWQIEAESIKLDDAKAMGVARNATLRIHDWPVLYTPYLSFPTSKARKSGFLMPVAGSTNVAGLDLALPYYLNLAPNYDATITPHIYSKRGLMWGGEFRYLTPNSFGITRGRFLPHDRAFNAFLHENQLAHPKLQGLSSDRWSLQLQNNTALTSDLLLGINFQQVSDDYFLQDFNTNLAILTERQLLRQGNLSYTTPHWLFRGMVQSYQTLHPINQMPIMDAYQRLPQLLAIGGYEGLPFNGNLSLLGQFDHFMWPGDNTAILPRGPRYHANPVLSFPQMRPWGFFTPSIEVVENYYDVRHRFFDESARFNRTIPRYSADGGLYFERSTLFDNKPYTQTLEPHLYYLYVPYHDQTQIPVYDSGYMIFTVNQLFRTNRFSGFDRIGDANQLTYALGSRWLSDATGEEKASFSIGQIRYFANRRVLLCQSITRYCQEDPLILGFLSPYSRFSPVAARGQYHFNSSWIMAADYAWDPATNGTNNGQFNFHYQSDANKIIGAGYSYLVNGDITPVAYNGTRRNFQDNPLHQATIAYSWPFNDKWSTLGAYNYNISKRYEMMSFFGVQYDNCCWAIRLIGGRAFRTLDSQAHPLYNNNIYLQILLKGLGTAGYSDPSSRIRTFIPGYRDIFRNRLY